MSVEIRLPNITAPTADGQMQQMKSYMYQLVQQLNWALHTVDSGTTESTGSSNVVAVSGTAATAQESAQDTFNSIKSLIIKSADIVNAYYDIMQERFSGEYVAESEFGTYKEETNALITKNSDSVKALYENLQTVTAEVNRIIDTNAWTKSGLLGYEENGVPIYGFEVGQKTIVDGVETFDKFSRFTAGGIYFYLPGAKDPIAWLSGTKLYITNAEITGEMKIAGFKIVKVNGLAFKWVGGMS